MSADFPYDPEFHDPFSRPAPRRRSRIARIFWVAGSLPLLFALSLPAYRSAREDARRSLCTNKLKQIALALHNYESAHGALPPAYTVDAQGRPLHSWRTLILPYLEEEPLYRTIDLSKPWNDPANAAALGTPVSTYRCLSRASGPENATTYLAIVGPEVCFLPAKPRRLAEITDNHGATIMVIEAGDEDAVPWMAPSDAGEFLVMRLGSTTKLHHPGGTNAVFVDFSVRFLKANVPAAVRHALLTISGGDDPSDDAY